MDASRDCPTASVAKVVFTQLELEGCVMLEEYISWQWNIIDTISR